MARGYITYEVGAEYLPSTSRSFTTKTKNAQEAHEAIRATDAQVSMDDVRERLGEQHAKVYDLIWRRFMASQMESAIYDQTTVLVDGTPATKTDITSFVVKTAGSILKFDGWMKF